LELLEAAVKAAALLRAQKEGENDHAGEKGRREKNGKRSPFSLLPFLLSATLFRNC
jgi:hypothetical protein